MITIEDFAKIDLRVGIVKKAERIPGYTKLLKLEVDIGSEIRTLIAGIGEKYSPEELVGKRVIVVANLKPKKIAGVESQGMILAAVDDRNNIFLVTVEGEVPPGAKVR